VDVRAIKHGRGASTYESDKGFFEIAHRHLAAWSPLLAQPVMHPLHINLATLNHPFIAVLIVVLLNSCNFIAHCILTSYDPLALQYARFLDHPFSSVTNPSDTPRFASPGHLLFRRLGLPLSWRPFGRPDAAHTSHGAPGDESWQQSKRNKRGGRGCAPSEDAEGEEAGESEPRLADAMQLCKEAGVEAGVEVGTGARGFIDYVGAWREGCERRERIWARAPELRMLEQELGEEPTWSDANTHLHPRVLQQ
jgi:hypothetical protein